MYSFSDKNRIIQSISSERFFHADKELFLKHCSHHRLEQEIKRANEFTYRELDERILSILLDKITEEDVLSNRISFVANAGSKPKRKVASGRKARNNPSLPVSRSKKKQKEKSSLLSPGETM